MNGQRRDVMSEFIQEIRALLESKQMTRLKEVINLQEVYDLAEMIQALGAEDNWEQPWGSRL